MKVLKNLVMKNEKQVSWSKIWAWITCLLGSIVLLHTQLITAGIPIPTDLMPIFKFATTISGLITAIRVRNAANGNIAPTAVTITTAPAASVTAVPVQENPTIEAK